MKVETGVDGHLIYVSYTDAPIAKTVALDSDLSRIVDYDAEGHVVGLEFLGQPVQVLGLPVDTVVLAAALRAAGVTVQDAPTATGALSIPTTYTA